MRTSKYLWKLMQANIHGLISQTDHTQKIRSNHFWPDNADWARKFRSPKKIESRGSRVQHISFAASNRTNTRTDFCCLYLIFVLHKIKYDPLSLLWWLEKARLRTSKYLCKPTPAKIHEVISKTKHTQQLNSKSLR